MGAEIIHPNAKVVKELPGLKIVLECWSILVVVTKTLAAYWLSNASDYKQLFTDGTSRCQRAIQNGVIGILTNGGYKMIKLSSGILLENESSKSVTTSITHTFNEGRRLLEWHTVTTCLYPGQDDLLDLIPASHNLLLAKLATGGLINTDGANASQGYQHNLVEEVQREALA